MAGLLIPAGQAMLAAAAVAVVVGVLAVTPRAVRVRRRASAVADDLAGLELEVHRALELLARQRRETAELVVPLRRIVRWLRHPLVAATIDWYLRRRRRS